MMGFRYYYRNEKRKQEMTTKKRDKVDPKLEVFI